MVARSNRARPTTFFIVINSLKTFFNRLIIAVFALGANLAVSLFGNKGLALFLDDWLLLWEIVDQEKISFRGFAFGAQAGIFPFFFLSLF
jgi:hypothetical protein